MPLVRSGDFVRIDLPENGEWVDVKRRLSRGDEIAVQRASVRGAVLIAGSTNVQMDAGEALEAAEFATLEMAIKAWSFDEPVTPEAIRLLDGDSIDVIKTRLDELYPAERTDEERKNLLGDGAKPSLAAVPSPTSLAG